MMTQIGTGGRPKERLRRRRPAGELARWLGVRREERTPGHGRSGITPSPGVAGADAPSVVVTTARARLTYGMRMEETSAGASAITAAATRGARTSEDGGGSGSDRRLPEATLPPTHFLRKNEPRWHPCGNKRVAL